MKLIALAATLALIAPGAFAKSMSTRADSIPALAKDLSAVLNDSDSVTHLQKGRSARALIVQKYLKDNKLTKVDENFKFSAGVTEIQETDGSDEGTATLEAAQNFVSSTISNQLNTDKDGNEISQKDLNVKIQQAAALLEKLQSAGAEFGYDSNGSGVCGVNYTTLFVIDVENKTIHEYVVVQGPC